MDKIELAEWLERMSVVAEAEGFRSAEFHVDKLREIAAALRESEEWRRDAMRTLWSVVYSAGGSVTVSNEAMIKCGQPNASLMKRQWPELTFTAQWNSDAAIAAARKEGM